MKLHPRVTKTAVELVKRFEGLRRRAARLPEGGWTVGYGHTLTAREGAEVTPEEAELLLYYDLSEVATRIDAWSFTPLNQNQFEALTAFAFNIGLENFRRSTVLKRINEGQHLQAAAAMELWRKTEVGGEGVVADALVRRRAAEKAHYLTPPEGFQPSPSQVLRPIFDHSVVEAAAQSQSARRASVVDAPLDGDQATASVRPEPEPSERAPPEPEASGPAEPEGEAEAGAVEAHEAPPAEAPEPPPLVPIEETAVAAPIAAAVATATLLGPESEPETEPESEPGPEEKAEPVPASTTVAEDAGAAVAALDTEVAPTFRGFEPPPRRFGRVDDVPPAAANQHGDEGPVAAEAPGDLPGAETAVHAGDFNLFDRPLAPPEPPRPPAFPGAGPVLAMDDHEAMRTIPAPRPVERSPALQDRTVLFSAIGLLGVALFALAIFTMLVGKATLWHLLIGFLGVVLITPAGVFFLMRRMGDAAAGDDAGAR